MEILGNSLVATATLLKLISVLILFIYLFKKKGKYYVID